MPYVLTILVAITLSMIAYQDCRSRSVYWWCFPVLAIGGLIMSLIKLGAPVLFFQYLFMNLFFLTLQLAVLKVYFVLRHRKNAAMINKKIGSGDLLFLAAVSFFFSPVNFLVFYLCSLLFTIVVCWMYNRIGKVRLG